MIPPNTTFEQREEWRRLLRSGSELTDEQMDALDFWHDFDTEKRAMQRHSDFQNKMDLVGAALIVIVLLIAFLYPR